MSQIWFERRLTLFVTDSVDVTLKFNHLIHVIKQLSSVEPFITLCNVVLAFRSVAEILMCGHSNKSYRAVLSCGAVYYAVQGGSNY